MASEIHFSTNPADWEKLEGLYVSERTPPGVIQGVDLSAVGIGGKTVRGPSTPQLITSPARFLEVYGGRDYGLGGSVINDTWKALLNKRFGTLVIRRIVAADGVAAAVTLDDTAGAGGANIVTITATSKGIWGNAAGNGPTVSVEAASDADANKWNLRVKYLGKEYFYENLNTQAGQNNLLDVIGDDVANPVSVAKLADGRPHNQADTALTGGSDGTLVSADYIAALTDLANYQGIGVVCIAEASVNHSALNTQIVAEAASATDRLFLTWSGIHGQAVATEITTKNTQIATQRDRVIWCFNSPRTIDPGTGTKVQVPPHLWMASILSQTDVDIHPGAHETSQYLAGVAELTNEALTRADLIALRAAGISTLEKLPGEFLFRSAVTTAVSAAKREITRRRMTDYLQLSASDYLKNFVKAKGTRANRAEMFGALVAFSKRLKSAERIIEEFAVESDSVNTDADRALGIEKLLWRVRLIGHMLHLVLETEIGSGVVIESQAA